MRRSDVDAALQELYDQVPSIPDCQGRCWVSCGTAQWSDREFQRARQLGYRLTPLDDARAQQRAGQTYWCEALTSEGRCAIYDQRPMACRLWGATLSMACPFGCEPEFWLTEEQALELMSRALAVGGGGRWDGKPITLANIEDVVRSLRHPSVQRIQAQVMAQGRAGVAFRTREVTVDGELVLPEHVRARRPR